LCRKQRLRKDAQPLEAREPGVTCPPVADSRVPPDRQDRENFTYGLRILVGFVFLLVVSAVGGRVSFLSWVAVAVIVFVASEVWKRRSGRRR
jgi:hypothetical protein